MISCRRDFQSLGKLGNAKLIYSFASHKKKASPAAGFTNTLLLNLEPNGLILSILFDIMSSKVKVLWKKEGNSSQQTTDKGKSSIE